ncbi:hypothetical protein DID88_006610 [Monilinia fructigena]|uniref:eIF3a PCI domain-containing protein n=1 Tax=Monilinia fructigena TaxID=38457 RepID=A0A395IGK6_9HELO|nr:hypothetical protein DID88_006610 [Monilinia fructigena]
MPPPPHQKPENVLKRAHELMGVGQSQAALVLLHEHVTSKKSRNAPIYFARACYALIGGTNISQNTNVGTIELVLKKFIELAEEKVKNAQAKADEVQSTLDTTAATASVDDLEATETPESILLSTVSGEQSRDRTDRAIVTPWLKFLWETYRTVLDILRNNARLEIMYQSTAMQAFDFCQKYTRKTEFRRFLSKRPPKNVMMANYYEKLTRIFLVGENYLFHAAAWSRYYNLLRQSAQMVAAGQSKKSDNPATSEADLSKAASFVLLSALAIPVISTSRSRGALVDIDEQKKNKNSRLTHLLGMAQAPTRAVLFKDAMSKGLLKRARPEIQDLSNSVQIGADAEMEKYVLPLQQVILTRLFQQLSQVYETVDLNFVENLAKFPEPFQVTRGTIEKFIMNASITDVFSSAKAVHAGSGAGSAETETASVQRLQNTPSEIRKKKPQRKRIKAAQLQEAEDKRLAAEQKKRENDRIKAELERVRKAELQKQIDDLKIGNKALDIDLDDLDNLDGNKLRALKLAQLEREKNDTNEKLRITGKRIDHLERAFRKEEAKKLPEDYEAQRQRDLAAYEKTKAQTLKDAEAKHKENVALKHRLARLVSFYESFRDDIAERRHEEFDKRRRDAEKELEKQIAQQHERKLREEEERAQREKLEKDEREEKRKAEFAELKAIREKERQEALEMAALQERRADEAARRRAEEKARGPLGWREKERLRAEGKEVPSDASSSPSAPPTRAEPPAASSGGPPRLALAGGNKPSWREREAAKAASGGGRPERPAAREERPAAQRQQSLPIL